MKKNFTLFVLFFGTYLTGLAQITQNFETVPNMSGLTGSCWQFSGVTLNTNNGKSLAINPPTAGGSAWASTPYINLTPTSTIKFNYKLSKNMAAGASRKVAVQLVDVDGKITPIGNFTLTDQASGQISFTGKSPLTGVRRLVVEVKATGDAATALLVDDLEIGGDFNFNAPYGCRERGDGTLSIHYLKTFQGLLAGDKVQLQWTVAENENNQLFEVEKSLDNVDFKAIATIQATTKAGEASYTYTDPLQVKAYYRLKVISKTNIRMYSNVVMFKTEAVNNQALALLQNPVHESLKFGFLSPTKAQAIVSVYNLSGVKVFQTSLQAWKGYNVITTPLDAKVKTGTYLLEVNTTDSRNVARFFKN